jgi:cytochrome c5
MGHDVGLLPYAGIRVAARSAPAFGAHGLTVGGGILYRRTAVYVPVLACDIESNRMRAAFVFVIMMTGGVWTLSMAAQEPVKNAAAGTVWDGVYTEAQAARGQIQYEATCRSCHREGPRKDEAFMRDWQGTNLDGLFSQVKTTMPAGAPASLSDQAYLDLVAYMLQVNAFPAGTSELNADAIKTIRVEAKTGPGPVPNFALVQSIGCLTEGPDADWLLGNATEPARTKDPTASTNDELRSSQAAALGMETFRLLNVYPRPDAYKGHKVEAKGFLIRDPAGNRINVTSVQSLAPRCE